jgi:hypothetical protein
MVRRRVGTWASRLLAMTRLEDSAWVVDQHVLDVLFLDPSRAERGHDVVGDMIVVSVRPRPVLVLLGLHVGPAVGVM